MMYVYRTSFPFCIPGLADDLLDDDLPYTTLSYAQGPAFYEFHGVFQNDTHELVVRTDLSEVPIDQLESFDAQTYELRSFKL